MESPDELRRDRTSVLQCLGSLDSFVRTNLSRMAAVAPAQSAFRGRVITALFDFAFRLKFSSKAAQLACVYFDAAAGKLGVESFLEMRQLAVLSLLLASKFEDGAQMDAQTVMTFAGVRLSAEQLLRMEAGVLVVLDWDLDRVTAAEVARTALAFSAPTHDFKEVIEESDEFASICYMDASMTQAGAIAIAVAAICCVFERRNSIANRDSWLDLVLPCLSVDRELILGLSVQIWTYLRTNFQVSSPTLPASGSE